MHSAKQLRWLSDQAFADLWERLGSIPVSRLRRYKEMNYETFCQTMYWFVVREKIMRDRRRRCQRCGGTYALHVHHTQYPERGTEHRHLDLLELVCGKCHAIEHAPEMKGEWAIETLLRSLVKK